MKLYPFQLEGKTQIQEQWESFPSVLYQLPTGGGKTVVITSVIEDIIAGVEPKKSKKIIILVHRIEIIFQIRDRLRAQDIDCGVIVGNYEENLESNIIVGSILTVARDRRLEILLNRNFDYMIIDEAHHACSDSYLKVITKFKLHNPNYRLLGVTATPYRKDKRALSKVFDVLIKGPTYSWLRQNGYLAGYKCYPVKLDDLDELTLSGGDFKISELSKYMRDPKLINLAIDIYKKRGNNEQMLVFCVDRLHAKQVQEAYIEAGYKGVALIDSHTPDDERKQINLDYREGKIQIIISIQTLTEGVDLPETKVVQLLRPTLSLVLYLQILGRGTRLKSDGSDLIILDCSSNTFTHGLLDSEYVWSLDETNPNPKVEDRKIVGKGKGGLRILDEEEISAEYEEVEEISHSEYLRMHSNGIDIAKNENKEKNQLILKKLIALEDTLNKKCKKDGYRFNFNTTDFINHDIFDKWKITNLKSGDTVCSFSTTEHQGKVTFKFENSSRWNLDIDDIINWEILGSFSKFIRTDKINRLITDSFLEVYEIYESKTNIKELETSLRTVRKTQLESVLNEYLKSGNHIVKLKEPKYLGEFRDFYGSANEIEFLEKPNKIRVQNKVQFYNDGVKKYYPITSPKERLIEMLFDNWGDEE